MSSLLTSRDVLKSWARDTMAATADAQLDRVIDAASDWVQGVLSWDILKATRTVILDGDQSAGRHHNVLFLPSRYRPVLYVPGTDDVTVAENGVTLVGATGYSTSADYIISHFGDDSRQGRLVRRPTSIATSIFGSAPTGTWAPGVQNITATFKSGYVVGDVPEDIVQVVCEAAMLFFRMAPTVGVSSTSRGRAATSIYRDLSEAAKEILRARTLP